MHCVEVLDPLAFECIRVMKRFGVGHFRYVEGTPPVFANRAAKMFALR
jgi:hypothetical protein